MLTRETVTFRDADGWSWEFDLTFMLSNYRCIWGRGCPDIRLERTARGCCVEGVEIYRGDVARGLFFSGRLSTSQIIALPAAMIALLMLVRLGRSSTARTSP